jgi:homoserine dehydrogenase
MKKLNLGLLGYGTVGKGVEILLNEQENMTLHAIFRRSGKATDPLMTDKISDLIRDPKIDTIVEAMGGLEPAHTYLSEALKNGKSVVTANKALVNAFGEELNALAIKNRVSFLFSAACGGGIPYLPTIKEALDTESVVSVGGILNGTTNFIIDKMEREALPFEEALRQAQALGYAEADPSGDLNGTDTMYKLRLALAVGMGIWVNQDSIDVTGINTLKAQDIAVFKQRNLSIRLLCFGNRSDGKIAALVEPTLTEENSQVAKILENNNLAWFKTAYDKTTVLTGQGAGSLPTASNILRDLKVIQNKTVRFLNDKMRTESVDNSTESHPYYVRTEKSIRSPFLDLNQVETWEDENFIYRITSTITVKTMHQEMRVLNQSGEVFFAGIALGGHHESL